MQKYLLEYKPFLLFLGKFFLSYLILSVLYQSYLNTFDQLLNQVDSFTTLVADQTQNLLTIFNNDIQLEKHLSEPSIKLIYNQKWIAKIIEGCNGMSVMILFVSFVIAFSGKIGRTVWYLFFGIVVIHVLNVVRIALLVVLIFYFPEYQEFLHGVVFPLIIYGIVFILWVVWVNKFSKYASKTIK